MKSDFQKGVVIGVAILTATFLSLAHEGRSYASSTEAMVLSLSSWIPKKLQPEQPAWDEMIKDLEQATGGKITIKVYYSQILGKAPEHYELVLKRTADIGYVNVGFTPGRFPITDMVSYAFAPSSVAYTRGLLEMLKKGYMENEYKDVKLLHVFGGSPSNFLWRKGVKAAKTLEEFKGRKIRVPTTGAADLVTAIGASPVAMPMPEVYTSMERGVVDGVLTSTNVLNVFRLCDVCEEITRIEALTFGFCIIMNKSTFDKLPEPAKALLEKNVDKYSMQSARCHDQADVDSINQCKPKFYDLQPTEVKKLKEMLSSHLSSYIEKYDAQGYKAKEAARTFNETLKKEFGVDAFLLKN